MISVLIPVYNYNVQNLVENLLFQFENADYEWEILLSDDDSSIDSKIQNIDFIDSVNNLNVKLYQQNKNIGNAANRNYLIKHASYDWLLFLDADVLCVNNNFISDYVKHMKSTGKEIIAGNIIYDDKNPLPHLLRWKYGKSKEEVSFDSRKKNIILNIRGANFAIKRKLARNVNFPILKEKYGFVDTYFFLQFKEDQIIVIDNPVYHLGLEDNVVYMKKTRQAISNALFLMEINDEVVNSITLISSYKKIKLFRRILANLYLKYYLFLERNLLSKKPSIKVFQLYKIMYISYLDVVKGTD